MKRAARMDGIAGFGIDRVAAAVLDGDVLRLENLDTDLGLPPEAVSVTRAALDDPVSNSWLPFTGDLGLRAAISEHIAARHGRVYDPEREIVVTCGGTEGVLDVLLATLDPGDEVVLHRSDLRGAREPRAAGGRGAGLCAAGRRRRRVAARSRRAGGIGERADGRAAADEPVDAVRAACSRARTGRSWRRCASSATCSCSTTPRWRRCCSTAARRVSPLDASRDGGADGDRRLDVQGLPDDRLARGLGRGPGRAGERRRLGAHLQHDRQRLRRAPRGRGRAARAAGARGARSSRNSSAGATRSSRRSRAGRSCGRRAAGRC